MTRFSLALVLSAAVAHGAAAQDVDCDNAVTQSEMNQCAYEAWMVEDEALNAAWAEAMAAMKAIDADLPEAEQGAADALRRGQKAWIVFRDETCAAEAYAMHGGSAEPLLLYGCMTQLTTQRTEGLTLLADQGY